VLDNTQVLWEPLCSGGQFASHREERVHQETLVKELALTRAGLSERQHFLPCKEVQREVFVEISLSLFPVTWGNQRFISRHSFVAAERGPGWAVLALRWGTQRWQEAHALRWPLLLLRGWAVWISPSLSRNQIVPWPHVLLPNQRKDFRIQNWVLCQGLDTLVQLHPDRQMHMCPRGQHWESPTFIPPGHGFLSSVSFNLRTPTVFSPGGDRPPHRASQARALLSFLGPSAPGPPRLPSTAGWKRLFRRPRTPPATALCCAVTSEDLAPAGGRACGSRERFQLAQFKSPRCAGAHLTLPGVTWKN